MTIHRAQCAGSQEISRRVRHLPVWTANHGLQHPAGPGAGVNLSEQVLWYAIHLRGSGSKITQAQTRDAFLAGCESLAEDGENTPSRQKLYRSYITETRGWRKKLMRLSNLARHTKNLRKVCEDADLCDVPSMCRMCLVAGVGQVGRKLN